MKKILITFVFALISMMSFAQSAVKTDDGKYNSYCEVFGYSLFGVGKLKVILDMGYSTKNENSLFGEDGKKIKFNSMMEVLDYMSKRGWRLVETYFISVSSKQSVVHYVLEKRVSSEAEKTEGLIIKPED